MDKDVISFSNSNVNKKVAILISDLRGFTALNEKYPDIAIVRMLNRYFNVMNRIIIGEYGGFIDKYMGDSIMVVFGINDENNILESAIECAIKMQIAMDEVNQENIKLGISKLYMGIAISYGNAVIARLGSTLHSELTVIGDVVNLASRIEAFSLRGQVLLSEDSYFQVEEFVEVSQMHSAYVKGKEASINFYDVLTCKSRPVLKVPQREVRKSQRVDISLAFNYQRLHVKEILEEEYDANTVDLSYEGLLAQIYTPIALFEEIKIKLFLSSTLSSEIYAKVVRIREDESKNIFAHLLFTSIDKESEIQLHQFIDTIIIG